MKLTEILEKGSIDQFKQGDVITFSLPHIKDREYIVTGIVGPTVWLDSYGREVDPRYDDGHEMVKVTYVVDGREINNVFSAVTLDKHLKHHEKASGANSPKYWQ